LVHLYLRIFNLSFEKNQNQEAEIFNLSFEKIKTKKQRSSIFPLKKNQNQEADCTATFAQPSKKHMY